MHSSKIIYTDKYGKTYELYYPIIFNSVYKGALKFTKIINGNYKGTYSVRADEGLEGDVEIPSTYGNTPVTTIAEQAFEGCSNLTSVTIPDSVNKIGWNAFYNCSNLTSVVIPNGVTSIGREAFYGCKSLTSVVIGNSVTYIGLDAFTTCSNLKDVYITDVEAWLNIESNYYGGLTSHGILRILDNKGNELTDIVIPDSITSISNYAFYRSNITSIVIPNSVTSIGDLAFSYCYSLAEILIPDSVTSIGRTAFYSCPSLANVVIGNGVTSIGSDAFNNCSNLTSVVIGDSVTDISEDAFYGCSSLTSIVIPDSVTSIGEEAFRECSSLTSVVIGNGVTSIGSNAFFRCSELVITVAEGNTAYYVENNCLYEVSTGKIIFGNANSTISSTATAIGGSAFSGTYAAPIKIPLSVTTIEPKAFQECENLVLHVEATSKPADWADDWCDDSVTVVWGYKEEDTNIYLVTESGEFLTDEQGNLLII